MFFISSGKQNGRAKGNDHGQENRPDAGGNAGEQAPPAGDEAGGKAEQHQSAHHPAFSGRRYDNGQEHPVQPHAQGAYQPQGQHAARRRAEKSPQSPAGDGNRYGAVGIPGVQPPGEGNGNAKNFIGHIKGNQHPVSEGRLRGQLLAERAAHQEIPGVGYQRHNGHFPIPRPGGDQGKYRVFSGRGVVGQALHHGLQSGKTGVPGGDAQGESYGKVAQRDRHAIPDAPAEIGLTAVQGDPSEC